MNLADTLTDIRSRGDWAALPQTLPFSRMLGLRVEVRGESFTCVMPFEQKLIGNPALPALHGGAVAGFMESAALMQVLLESTEPRLPKSIDFSLDYLRSARTEDCHAACELVRQGRRVAAVQIRCWQRDPGKPIATARAHFLLAEVPESTGMDRQLSANERE